MARDFRAWGELYAPPAEQPIPPDPLHYIADYMSDLGNQRASLQVRAEAKKADFPLPWARCWSELGSELGSEPFRPDACATVLGNLGARFIFLPTDFGTKPENALIILIGATTLAWCIYRYCRRDWRPKWPDLREDRDRLAKRQRLEGDMQQHLATSALARAVHDGRRPDLSDVGHAPFIFADDTMASSVEERIDEAALRKHLDAILDQYAPAPRTSALTPGELMHLSEVPGFMQYDRNRQPQNFDLIRYAVDVSIPVVDLHAYSQYYPVTGWVRGATVVQHLIGWWVLTSFLASLAAF